MLSLSLIKRFALLNAGLFLSVSALAQMQDIRSTVNSVDTSAAKALIPSNAQMKAAIAELQSKELVNGAKLSEEQAKSAALVQGKLQRLDPSYSGADKVDYSQGIGVKAPTPGMMKAPDIAELSRMLGKGFSQQPQVTGNPLIPGYEAIMFVSLSMPRANLVVAAQHAQMVGIPLALRGLKGDSIKQTFQILRSIQKEAPKTTWLIHPPAFTKFKVKQVPTLVMADAFAANVTGADGCAPASSYIAITGDVPLAFALEQIEKTSAEFALPAGALLEKLR